VLGAASPRSLPDTGPVAALASASRCNLFPGGMAMVLRSFSGTASTVDISDGVLSSSPLLAQSKGPQILCDGFLWTLPREQCERERDQLPLKILDFLTRTTGLKDHLKISWGTDLYSVFFSKLFMGIGPIQSNCFCASNDFSKVSFLTNSCLFA
jgi:hypothetical protein